ncbi:hypothetical protein BU14_0319s0004 [Porphyra umbilicalis]|uniref:PhoD-like phosphatase metallophosphatase domain-containing protein n=1 Tax=Porphyra umbilicalis TaxID=2786 RepID=A0A1X6NZG6_PORUM|nr:hypothetical protein BU14_0319s0004 [Porphyra umbilicalis]|eukprot:OSX73916.1 hypothetical protein BU14_0319s0004 [Porphyra umbilicalis]
MQSGDVSPTTAIIQASVSQAGCRSPPFLALTSNVTVRVCTVAPGASGGGGGGGGGGCGGGGGGGSRCTAGTVLHTTVVARAYVGVDPRVYPGAYIAKVFLDGLTPATDYAYEFVAESGVTSPTGTFRTLPPPEEEGEVAFLHISCANENPYPVAGVLGNLTAPGSDYAFVLQNGDSVYADRFWLRGKNYTEVDRCCAAPTPSLDYYRSLYADQRDAVYTSAGFPDMQRQIPIFTSIDDHHVNDNYAGNGGDPRTIQEVFPPGRGTPSPSSTWSPPLDASLLPLRLPSAL